MLSQENVVCPQQKHTNITLKTLTNQEKFRIFAL